MTICGKKLGTTALTFIAMVVGAILGLTFGKSMGAFKFIGTIWLNGIKMIVCPLILTIMVTAVASQKNLSTLGRIAARIMIYYFITTALAVVIGLGVASFMKPGTGIDLAGMSGQEIKGAIGQMTVGGFLTGLMSNNLFKTLTNGNMMQTIVIALFLGVSVLMIKDEKKKNFMLEWFVSAKEMIYCYLGIMIKWSPVGVLFLIADTFGTYGFAIFGSMFSLISTFWLGIFGQIILVYGISLLVMAHINPVKFLIQATPVWTFTMASCSSSANIPVSIKVATERFKCPKAIADFCIPLGAQLNFDGTAIMFATVIMFVSQVYNIPFSIPMLIQIVVVASLLSSSGGGIPGSGLIKLMAVISTFNMPVEIVGIMAGFYRFFDMGTTTNNCLGDLVGTICVSEMEKRRAKKLGYNIEDLDNEALNFSINTKEM